MNLVQNFGKDALDMMRWIETVEFPDSWLIKEYHKHLSQPMGTWMFVSGEEPIEENYLISVEEAQNLIGVRNYMADPNYPIDWMRYEKDFKRWQNWTPMFEGEWEIIPNPSKNNSFLVRYNGELEPLMSFSTSKTLNDFLTQVTGLKYDYRYEMD